MPRERASPLPECPGDLIVKWLEQILQRRPCICLNECLDRHSRHKPQRAYSLDLVLRKGNTNKVIYRAGLATGCRLACEVRSNLGDCSCKVGHGALIACHNSDDGWPAERNLIDVLWRHFGFNHERVG